MSDEEIASGPGEDDYDEEEEDDYDEDDYDGEMGSDDDGLLDSDDAFELSSNDDEIMGAFDDDHASHMKRIQSYEVLTLERMNQVSEQIVSEVREMCAVPSDAAASMLLREFEWNKEKLIEAMMDDRDGTLKRVGLTDEYTLETAPSSGGEFECLVCDEMVAMAETFALGCGHRYCKDCYKGFLEATIKDGARSIYCHCPAPDCEVIVHEDAFRTLVSEEQFARYLLFLKRSFVDDNPTVKWCPFPGCTSAVRVERTGRQQPVACVTCGNSFCFVCCDADKGDHNPVTCESLDAWIAKGEDESENVKWMIANTKKCPKCRSPIEKDGGCMHMTCHGCRHDFCWMCRGDWSEHGSATGGYYSCNKYDASSAKAEDSAADAVKTDLEYYMFYFHRFDSHRIGLRDTIAKARALSQFQIELATNFEVRTQDTEFLNEAFAQLQQNKRVLMHSYIMGFSLKKGDASKNLFEYLQEDLEKYTNALSDMCDKTIDDIEGYDSFMKWKEEVANYTRVTAKFLDGFVQGAVENDWT